MNSLRGGGTYKKIYAWEPDEENIKQMKKALDRYDNVVIIPYGMWKEKTELGFMENGDAESRITDEAPNKIRVDSIDNICSGETVTFIKMDIEGSEMNALQGAINTIKRDKPRLAICIYHSLEDLYRIPLWIKETFPEYRIYIRHHSDNEAETVVYATV